jgi:CxxC motif-containing protein
MGTNKVYISLRNGTHTDLKVSLMQQIKQIRALQPVGTGSTVMHIVRANKAFSGGIKIVKLKNIR